MTQGFKQFIMFLVEQTQRMLNVKVSVIIIYFTYLGAFYLFGSNIFFL